MILTPGISTPNRKNKIIYSITDQEGISFYEQEHIELVLLKHFKEILALADWVMNRNTTLSNVKVIGRINAAEREFLSRPINNDEIEAVIKFANPNKAPGPDGFNAHFLKICWPIIGMDVCAAIKDFFTKGRLLK